MINILDWLQSIGDFLIAICTFLIQFFKNVIELVVLVFKGFVFASQIVLYLPLQYQAVILAFIAFAVIVSVVHFGG